MDCQAYSRPVHPRKPGSFDMLAFRNRIAHDVAWAGLPVHGEDEFIDGIVEIEQL